MAKLVNSAPSIGQPLIMLEHEVPSTPSPDQFDIFLPWACKQLQVNKAIIIKTAAQQEFVRSSRNSKSVKKGKGNIIGYSDHSAPLMKRKSKSDLPDLLLADGADYTIIIEAYYQGNDLVHIKFGRSNPLIPREVIKIITLIAKFYPQLTKLSVHDGLSAELVHDISSLVPMSRITELIFDDSLIEESNFHILLDKPVNLMHLSLARCQITDNVVRTIADKLMYPKHASETLSILNLSTNLITDVGANYLAQVLRTNRQLKYLNIANNAITDDGAGHIFSSLYVFPLTYHEYMEVNRRYMEYAKDKNKHIVNILADMKKSSEYIKYMNRGSSRKSFPTPVMKGKKGRKAEIDFSFGIKDIEEYFYAKAKEAARGICGDFIDPFSRTDAFSKNGLLYSNGNNSLSYLNISFNELTIASLRTILKVLTHQHTLNRIPLGLLNLRIDGNYMPVNCTELYQIDDLLELRLNLIVKTKRNVQKNK